MAKSTLEEKFVNEGVPYLTKEFGYKNLLQVPSLKMIVVNTSLKEATQDAKVLDSAAADMAAITGQRPVITRAKKSISNFKLRQGQPIGCRVTLRRRRMFEFMNRLVNVALPRVRDFKGVDPKSFDGRGNYTLGLTEQIIFPEINPDKVAKVFGMNITFVTTAKTDKEGKALLKFMGMPFKN
jgi:large subunit ribosomal protein L5